MSRENKASQALSPPPYSSWWTYNAFTLSSLLRHHFQWPRLHSRTRTLSSPPPPASPTSPSSLYASRSFSLSRSHLHSTLSQKPVSKSAPFRSQTQLNVNPHPSLIHTRWTMFQMTSTRQLSMAQAVSEVRICFIHYPDILTQLLQSTASQALSRVLPKLSWGNQLSRITL